MKRSTKIIIAVISIPVLIVVLAIGTIGYYLLQEARDNAQEEKIKISVKYNIELCSEKFPLFVEVINDSSRTIDYIDFDIEIRRVGHSSDISDFSGFNYNSDKIIEPGKASVNCWSYALRLKDRRYDDPDNLEFGIGYKSIRFKR